MGGRAGSRLAQKLWFSASSFNTLLRLITAAPLEPKATPQLLGVDDFAIRKGHTYATILIDLATHDPIEVLPDREAETFADWLKEHPGVEVISRDRAGSYADGGRRGAPDALQIADRFHLYMNLTGAVEDSLRRKEEWLSQVELETNTQPSASLTITSGPCTVTETQLSSEPTPVEANPVSRTELAKQNRAKTRQKRYEQMQELRKEGYSQAAIATHLGLDPRTVSKWLKAGKPLEPSSRRRYSVRLGPYKQYLDQQWEAGERNVKILIAQIKTQGYMGGSTIVYDYLKKERVQLAELSRPVGSSTGTKQAGGSRKGIKVRKASWLLMKDYEKLSAEQQALLQGLCERNEEIAKTRTIVESFKQMFREHQLEKWGEWHELVAESKIPELLSFSAGLRRDEAAVKAAIVSDLSNGPTEGAVNRIKNIKRQMYGRAKLPLLRKRVLKTD